jgi:hypothetical protein
MKGISKASVRSVTKIQVLLLVVMILIPVMSFGADGLPTLNAYLPYAANPLLRCVSFYGEVSATSRITLPGDNNATEYIFFADAGTDPERLICDIANDPYNKSLIDQGSWRAGSNLDIPVTWPISFYGSESHTYLLLFVGNQTFNYTFMGPLSQNHDLTCCTSLASVPAFNHWGLLLFALLLIATALWFARRRRTT